MYSLKTIVVTGVVAACAACIITIVVVVGSTRQSDLLHARDKAFLSVASDSYLATKVQLKGNDDAKKVADVRSALVQTLKLKVEAARAYSRGDTITPQEREVFQQADEALSELSKGSEKSSLQ